MDRHGTGRVGSTLAYTLLLVDSKHEIADGERLDLEHAEGFISHRLVAWAIPALGKSLGVVGGGQLRRPAMGQQDQPISLDDIMAQLIAQRLAGQDADIEGMIAAHPEHAEAIRTQTKDLPPVTAMRNEMHDGGEAPSAAAQTLAPGTRLGEFEIGREIGRGGMGVVYLARQSSLDRDVAMKVIPPASLSEQTRQRFLREAKALGSLSHPNIVPVFTAGQSEGMLYIAMEYVEGVTLSKQIAGVPGRPDNEYVERCLGMIAEVARALAVAHDKGIIHRDIKPGNIIIRPDGRARLLDFGLAAVQTEPHVTLSGEFFGTPYYVSPEQARGQTDLVGPASDVYSLGATLYECLTLSRPFDGDSTAEVLSQVLEGKPTSPRTHNPSLPKAVESIIMRALATDPCRRQASMGEFVAEIEQFLSQARRRRTPEHARGSRWAIGVMMLALLAAGVCGLVYLLALPEEPAPQATPAPSITVEFHPGGHGTVLHDGAMLRATDNKYATLDGLSAKGVTTVRFYPDGEIAPGLRVEATQHITEGSAGEVIPKGTRGTVKAVRVVPNKGTVYDIAWDGIAPRPIQPVLRGTFKPAKLGKVYEDVPLHPGRVSPELHPSTVCCFYLPKGRPLVETGHGVVPTDAGIDKAGQERIGRLVALLDALRKIVERVVGFASGAAPRWVAFGGLRLLSDTFLSGFILGFDRISIELPFGPKGGVSRLSALNFEMVTPKSVAEFDYLTPLQTHLSGNGIRVVEEARGKGKDDGIWEVKIEAAGVPFFRPGRSAKQIESPWPQ